MPRPSSPLPARARAVAVAVAVATLVPVGLAVAPATTVHAAPVVVETTPPAPEPTTPPPDAPAPTVAPGEDAGDDGVDWVPIALIALGVLALILILGMVLGRGSTRRTAAPARRSPAPSQQANLLSTAQWIHDQLTLELAAADPASAAQRWAHERSRLDDVAIGAQQQWQQGGGEAWQTLAQTMSSLGAAVDTNVTLRAQTPPDPTLIAESTQVVNRHRAALHQLITAMWPSVRR